MQQTRWKAVFPGVWKYDTGKPPVMLTGLAGVKPSPFLSELPETEKQKRPEIGKFNGHAGIRVPLAENEHIFGYGLIFIPERWFQKED